MGFLSAFAYPIETGFRYLWNHETPVDDAIRIGNAVYNYEETLDNMYAGDWFYLAGGITGSIVWGGGVKGLSAWNMRAAGTYVNVGTLSKVASILRKAEKSEGLTNMGFVATYDEAIKAGKEWVGEGYRVSKSGKAWISKDGLRQFRPPTWKPRQGKIQANFEWRTEPTGDYLNNAHLNIIQ